MHPKPPQILKIEKILGFELTETEDSGDISNSWHKSKLYLLNEKQEVIGLNVCKCELKSIDFLQHLPNLISLHFGSNQISDISVLQHLPNLTNLDFGANQVSDISVLQHLINLTELHFWGNQVSDISSLQHLINLTYLEFNINQVNDIKSLQNLTNLTVLYFSDNVVLDISVLEHFKDIEHLVFEGNQVADISSLKHLKKLKNLLLGKNQVLDISVLHHLTSLTGLDFGANQVSDISVLQHLTNLTELRFGQNQVSDISVLQHLTNLTDLHFSENQISDISVLQHLANLIILRFEYNQVSDISVFQHLTNLTDLHFSNNKIKTLPTFFANFKALRLFNYEGNPFARYMPRNLKFKDKQEEIQYILALQANSQPVREAKVVLVGEGKIGKTTLLGWLLEGKKPETERTDKIEIRDSRENQFSYYNEEKQEKENLTVHFWDFGGQEIMHATHKFFMTERTVYVLVTDHRNLKDSEVRKWLKQLETTVGNSPVILVANQCDKIGDKHRLKDKEYRAAFPNLDIREVIETSGETGFGLDKLQKAIQTALQDLEFLSFPIPTPFFKAKEKVVLCIE